MRRQVVVREWYLCEVQRCAYLLWKERQRKTHLDDWHAAQVWIVGRHQREEDIRRLAFQIYQGRLAKGPLDDWLEAERQTSQYYEIAA